MTRTALTPQAAERKVRSTSQSEEGMVRALTSARIIDAVSDAAQRWTDADFAPRVRATRALIERTGYSEPVVDYALDRLFETIDRDALRNAIAGELGSLVALEEFVARPGRPDVTFRSAGNVAIVASDTTIGVAIPALVFALCAKAEHVLVKDREDRLVAAFAETLAQERPELAARTEVDVWAGTGEPMSDGRLRNAQVVVAYGGDVALRAIRSHLGAQARFVPFGHRTSVGYVTRETLDDLARTRELADAAALDALLYDGDGCLSLHALFVERGAAIDPAAFALELSRACDRVAIELPPGSSAPDARVLAYRRAALFRAAQGHGSVYGDPHGTQCIVYDAAADEPPPLLPRTIALYPVDTPAQALSYLRHHVLPLEAFALPRNARPDIEAFALASGASRIARFGTLQRPPLGGEHGGEGRILPFVRAIYRA